MKRTYFIVMLCIACCFNSMAQNNLTLREDNIEAILNAMTDWGCKENTVKATKAGNDLMEWSNQIEIDRILAAVNSGEITQEELDRNVRNMLNYIVKTPHFRKYNYSNKPDLKAHAAVARKGAAESIVLLKNDNNTLPLNGAEGTLWHQFR